MQHYTIAFLFSEDLSKLALIRKKKPQWQFDKLNGIGGKVESKDEVTGESSPEFLAAFTAMRANLREFQEETGRITKDQDWMYFCRVDGNNYVLHFFCGRGDCLESLKNPEEEETGEKIEIHHTFEAFGGNREMLPNVPWLVSLAYGALAGDLGFTVRCEKQDDQAYQKPVRHLATQA